MRAVFTGCLNCVAVPLFVFFQFNFYVIFKKWVHMTGNSKQTKRFTESVSVSFPIFLPCEATSVVGLLCFFSGLFFFYK